MSRFFSSKYSLLSPYTPGEQPQDMQYVKLNTNESPFPPSPKALAYMQEAAQRANLYPDPECRKLTEAISAHLGVSPEEILLTNGSDEILNFAFMAFCDKGAAFPDITYGFYSVFASLNHVPYRQIPLNSDFTVNLQDYMDAPETLFLANPNAPTGIALSPAQIEALLRANPNRLVVVDEAYVDFGNESCVPLIHQYDNLLVTQTFSKSRSMAGARLGFGVGCRALIRDLRTIKYSTNPYNINTMTMAAGLGTMEDQDYTQRNCQTIIENREYTAEQLRALGFTLTPSTTNFLFAKHPAIDGKTLYQNLKQSGVLVRHFDQPQTRDYIRITIGTRPQMDILLNLLRKELTL